MNVETAAKFPDRWPPVTVLIVTYRRPVIIRRVIRRYETFLQYPGKLLWRLADDGSPQGYVDDLLQEFARLNLQATVTPHCGFGANLNNGLREAFKSSDYVFLTEDDWATLNYINIGRGVWLLESVPEIGLVRYDDLGPHMRYAGAVLKHPEMKKKSFWVRYFIVDKGSKYIYPGGHPNLVHKRYYDSYGFYKEGGEIASVERAFSEILATQEGPEIAIMSEYMGVPKFVHIGRATWKGTKEGDPNYGVR